MVRGWHSNILGGTNYQKKANFSCYFFTKRVVKFHRAAQGVLPLSITRSIMQVTATTFDFAALLLLL